ncbi:addiction module protein [Gloeobacter violaceus]|uniref:Gsr1690 protein n=1 Tax=Gloeobacter violaceus (strain ATCC 29082 / PCC 7421) TaxID=251221 RepID=Q7NJZ1_GLOVI|nr:addiction module protein [Gloeobacter violaceus]BAC89631.1 gsr1690 [Gloeobacter violaceus PCC 7421]
MDALSQDEITRLTPQERLALIEQLWDSLDESAIPLPDSQQAELSRRLVSLHDDRSQALTWEQLRSELARRRS